MMSVRMSDSSEPAQPVADARVQQSRQDFSWPDFNPDALGLGLWNTIGHEVAGKLVAGYLCHKLG